MFFDWKNYCYEYDYSAQSSLQIQCNAYQITNGIFHRIRIKLSQFVWKCKRPQIPKPILRKKNRAEGLRFPDFRLYYKATVIKTVWCWHKDRIIYQRNRLQLPEINSCSYSHLIHEKWYEEKGNIIHCWWECKCRVMYSRCGQQYGGSSIKVKM